MKTYEKKPVRVQAIQFLPDTPEEDLLQFLEGCEGWYMGDDDGIIIPTLEGEMTASSGDWIIRGIKGEFYPCKPDIFEASYREVIWDSPTINREIITLEATEGDKTVFYFGWYWREVDFDAPSCALAVAPGPAPSWWKDTVEHKLLNLAWKGGQVGFCESNKWGYPMFRVEGEEWEELKRKIISYLEHPSSKSRAEVNAYMISITPKELFYQEI